MRVFFCLAALVGGVAVLVWAPLAAASGVQCTGTMSGTIDANVVVPPGASCNLNGATVTGNVSIEEGASLDSGFGFAGSTIVGNVSATDPVNVILLRSNIGGDVSITGLKGGGCTSGLGADTIAGNVDYANSASGSNFFEIGGGTCGDGDFANTIVGNVNIESNQGAVMLNGDGAGGGNQIGGNVDASGNTGGGSIHSNTIQQNFNCSANTPAYSVTGNNVSGNNNC
jgi:hypothetical protein